jgi:hypothetical protein
VEQDFEYHNILILFLQLFYIFFKPDFKTLELLIANSHDEIVKEPTSVVGSHTD